MKYYGLYKITNLVNGKMYIGQHVTDNLEDGYMGSGHRLKCAIKKYGIENFRKEWLGFYEDQDELDYMERVFVDETWLMRADTYNLCIGGRSRGLFQHTEEAKQKISSKQRGRKHSLEHNHKIAVANSGENNYWYGTHGPMYGKSHTEESRCKAREANKGLVFWNDGIKNVRSKECPKGFIRGKLTKKPFNERGENYDC